LTILTFGCSTDKVRFSECPGFQSQKCGMPKFQ